MKLLAIDGPESELHGRLGILPTPAEDELAYSIVARTKAILGISGNHTIMRSAFGRTANYVSPCLPGNLSVAAAWFPGGSGLNLETLVSQHTTLPYFGHFLSQAQYLVAERGLTGGWQAGSFGTVGHFRSKITRHPMLNFCPKCAAEDAAVLGMAAWRRLHQLPGVLVCPQHGVRLRASGIRNKAQHALVCCPKEASAGSLVPLPLDAAPAQRLAETSRWLLDNGGKPLDPAALATAVRDVLATAGLASRGRIDGVGFLRLLAEKFGEDGLSALGCGLDSERPDHAWPTRMCRKGAVASHPLRYLLVCEALCIGISDLVRSAMLVQGDKRENRPRTTSTKARSRRLRTDRDARLALHRSFILSALKRDPGLSRSDFQRAHKGPYAFLKQHDRAWFDAVVPRSVGRQARVDWDARDCAMASHVAEAIRRLRVAPGRPARITVTRIAAEVGIDRRLIKHIGKLPRCAELIAEAVETHVELTLRRINWAASEVLGHGTTPSWTEFANLIPIPDNAPTQLSRIAREMHAKLQNTSSHAAVVSEEPPGHGSSGRDPQRHPSTAKRTTIAITRARAAWRTSKASGKPQ